jgi:hypothetical protein
MLIIIAHMLTPDRLIKHDYPTPYMTQPSDLPSLKSKDTDLDSAPSTAASPPSS